MTVTSLEKTRTTYVYITNARQHCISHFCLIICYHLIPSLFITCVLPMLYFCLLISVFQFNSVYESRRACENIFSGKPQLRYFSSARSISSRAFRRIYRALFTHRLIHPRQATHRNLRGIIARRETAGMPGGLIKRRVAISRPFCFPRVRIRSV